MRSRDQFLDANGIDATLGTKRDPLHFRTIWISDVHLGTPGCQAQRLLEFLRATESETLYLVGDIIDGWQLKRRWYWEQSHNNVVQTVLKKAKKGTNVIFVPGNHDEVIRQFIDLDFGGIKIRDELVHTTANGKRMLVIHGDRFDGVIACAKWLAYVGDNLYTMILKFNQWFNSWRARAGLPYWSLSQYLKGKVKNAVNYITSFEDALAAEASKKGLDGVICGHIHKPEIRDINGIKYCNDGDWVESLSALVEDEAGELRLVTWGEIMQLKKSSKLAGVEDLCALPS
ncbi:UDP-2,3-diacylglucosamine diphosphatase [Herbaspirillum lusitanum]|uniref:UDP-2,3-diacylglucosamine diphosphatase n=1 Tax=Herbaspirillum lusitanum TaxID=213312 RepID=UPI00031ACF61|nr:UDP-2,3-diacylglucosamine diphosphatase [Herbaspirillum lusitanum]MCW5300274.1 UDP-2,3-diacylglucosamine diphosphatase [Herbaspirillum lusitanum]